MPREVAEILADLPSIFAGRALHGSGRDHAEMTLRDDPDTKVIVSGKTPQEAAEKLLDFARGHTGGPKIDELQDRIAELTAAKQDLDITCRQLREQLAAAESAAKPADETPPPEPAESAPPTKGPSASASTRGAKKKAAKKASFD